jgi:hypothetical protein
MDLTTALYVSMGVSAFLGLFYIVATIIIIFILSDIRMELRTLNDNTIDK